ncbi:MAG: hypothetical protein RL442_1305, partial [Pseudomonadota bacterium]
GEDQGKVSKFRNHESSQGLTV